MKTLLILISLVSIGFAQDTTKVKNEYQKDLQSITTQIKVMEQQQKYLAEQLKGYNAIKQYLEYKIKSDTVKSSSKHK